MSRNPTDVVEVTTMENEKEQLGTDAEMRALLVLFRTKMSVKEALRRADELKQNIRKTPGLLQHFYIRDPSTGQFGGFIVFDSEKSLAAFRESGAPMKALEAFQIEGAPEVRPFQIGTTLYPMPRNP